MTPLHKSALIALALLAVIAAIGYQAGSGKADPEDAEPGVAVIDLGSLDTVELLPPEKRERWIGAEDFRAGPVRHPRAGGDGPGIHELAQGPPREPIPEELVHSTYRVREGDGGLIRIAEARLGDGAQWRRIAALNGIEPPYRVKVGELLLMPTGDEDAGPPPAPPGGGEDAAAGDGAPRRYTVRKNETPSDVALEVYGDATLWRHLLAANGLEDPRDLRAGAVLVIPPPPRE